MSAHLSAFLRGMTRYDAYFHMLLAGALVGGLLFMNTAGESAWNSLNKGVRLGYIMLLLQTGKTT